MRKYIVAGNWKMNGSKESISLLLDGIKEGSQELTTVEWLVFPSFPFLEIVKNKLADSNIAFGAQNFSQYEKGAYTGEVSLAMLKDFGCQYVLVGHSERRHIFGETDAIVAAKYSAAVAAGIKPILCIGETLEERNNSLTEKVVNQQLDAILSLDHGLEMLAQGIIAYEPVWAIGTGVTAKPEQAEEVHSFIRSKISYLDVKVAQEIQILYGGSVKPNNALALFAMPNIDGGLIGGASLNAEDFVGIGRSCNR